MGITRRWLPRSLRGRITAAYLAALVLALGVFGTAGSVLGVKLLRTSDTDELVARLGDLAAAVQAGDLTPVAHDPYAQVIDGDTVLARSSATPDAAVLTPAELGKAATGQTIFYRSAPGLGKDAALAATPLPGGRIAVTGISLDSVNTAAKRLVIGISVTVPLLLLLLGLGVRQLIGAALRPVASLTSEAQAISTADPGRRLPVPSGEDEINALARTLNEMLDRISAVSSRERAFLNAAAHELRTPVAALRAELELGLSAPDGPQTREALHGALRETDRLSRLTTDWLTMARATAGQLPLEREPTDVTDRVRATATRLASIYPITVEVTGAEVVADVDPVRVDQILTNLVANAGQADARRVVVDVRALPDGSVRLTVDDDGPGFPQSMLPVTFPEKAAEFPVPRHDSTGTGLGLTIVDMVARAHGGRVTAGNTSPLGGASVVVDLPGPA